MSRVTGPERERRKAQRGRGKSKDAKSGSRAKMDEAGPSRSRSKAREGDKAGGHPLGSGTSGMTAPAANPLSPVVLRVA